MSDLTKVKNLIQESAWYDFPAQELWLNENDLYFWAYYKGDGIVSVTTGRYVDEKLVHSTTDYPTADPDNFVDREIDSIEKKGYTCFAMELFL
jgi:hypothetical protein